jgi:hypothetical protein
MLSAPCFRRRKLPSILCILLKATHIFPGRSGETDGLLIVDSRRIYFFLGKPRMAQQDRLKPTDHKKGSQ